MLNIKLIIDEASLQKEDVLDTVNFQLILANSNINGPGPMPSFNAFIEPSKEVKEFNAKLEKLDTEIKSHDAKYANTKEGKNKKTEYKKLLKEKNEKESTDRNDYNNIVWIWSSFNGKPNFSCSDRNSMLHGATKLKCDVQPVHEGGGLMWLEPFYTNSEPKNTPPNGWFISSKGRPKILSAQWREDSPKNDGAKIVGSKKFNKKVQLHIYTEGLYGQDIEVKLMDHDFLYIDPDDNLSIKTVEEKQEEQKQRIESEEKLNAQKQNKNKVLKEKPSAANEEEAKQEEQKKSDNNHYEYFITEVGSFPLLADERDENKRMVISEIAKIFHVQKTVLTVYLDPI